MTPDPEILAVLTPENLVSAYVQGAFPMVQDGELLWFSPKRRGLMPLDERFHVSRSLARTIRRGVYACTIDHCFDAVVARCADRPPAETWISAEIRIAYGRLHELGLAHSIESWPAGAVGAGQPVGGLYGVALGGAFFGESMFHTATDAGKVALAFAVDRLRAAGFVLFDVQWTTPNLARFGVFEMPRKQYLAQLHAALELECRLG
jgi:leucyl/phenylalanyl-tRNA--protein transferase